MTKVQKTRFGSLEKILENDKKVIAEIGTFEKSGRSHTHDDWELCTILSGEGDIIVKENGKENKHYVKTGDFLAIAPNTGHWMVPAEKGDVFKILITYSSKFNYS